MSTPAYPYRLRINDNRDQLPVFAGCPDWAKPLLFQEYQVTIPLNPTRTVNTCNFQQFMAGWLQRRVAVLDIRKPH
jgi:hypothetical protein